MKISVIIPAYNEEARLPETLKAILAQDYPDYEVILVDNASTDRTFEVALSFQGMKVVREERKGTMWACERGRKEASGDIIVRMDADCIPDARWLSRGAKHFANPKVAAVTGPYDYYDGGSFMRRLSLIFQIIFYPIFNSLMQVTKKGAVMIGGNSFMRASALTSAGGFNTSVVFYGDDTDTAKRVARSGKVKFDTSLVMKTSARRLKAQGFIRLELRYIYYFFKTIYSN